MNYTAYFTAIWAACAMCLPQSSAAFAATASENAKTPSGANAIENSKKGFRDVDPTTFDQLRKDTNHVVLDVRSAKEHQQGHIPGAVLLDVNSPDFKQKAASLSKDQTYLVHCAAGVRSVKACGILRELKFEKLVNLEGGFKAWEKAGKPVQK